MDISPELQADFFVCANGFLIVTTNVTCDGYNNCGDFSDEEYCRKYNFVLMLQNQTKNIKLYYEYRKYPIAYVDCNIVTPYALVQKMCSSFKAT